MSTLFSRKPLVVFLAWYALLLLGGTLLLKVYGGLKVEHGLFLQSNDQYRFVQPLNWEKAFSLSAHAVSLTGGKAAFSDSAWDSFIDDDAPSLFTQFLLLFLVELSAITLISFSLFFLWRLGMGHTYLDKELGERSSSSKVFSSLIKRSVLFLLILQIVCFLALVSLWRPGSAVSMGDKLWQCLYYAIMGVTGAGFELNVTPAHALGDSPVAVMAFAVFMLAGWLGYPVFADLLSVKRLRERVLNPKKNWTLHTRVWLGSALMFIAVVTAFHAADSLNFRELDERSQRPVGKVLIAFGQTISSLTTGYKMTHGTYDFYSFTWLLPALLLFLAGAPAGGTGSGLRFPVYFSIFKLFRPIHTAQGRALRYTFIRVMGIYLLTILVFWFITAEQSCITCFSVRKLMMNTSALSNSGIGPNFSPYIIEAKNFLIIFGRIGIPALTYYWLRKKQVQLAIND